MASNWQETYKKLKKRKELVDTLSGGGDLAPVKTTKSVVNNRNLYTNGAESIIQKKTTPVKTSTTKKKTTTKKEKGLFDAFDDGYDFGDVTKTILTGGKKIWDSATVIGKGIIEDPKQTFKTIGVGIGEGFNAADEKVNNAVDDFFDWIAPSRKDKNKNEVSVDFLDLEKFSKTATDEEKAKVLKEYEEKLGKDDPMYHSAAKILSGTNEKNIFNSKYYDTETYEKAAKGELSDTQQEIYEQSQSAGGMAYDLLWGYMTGGTASGLGATAKTAKTVSEIAGKTSLFVRSQQSTYEEAIAEGYSEKEARMLGVTVGGFEVGLESIGFDEFKGLDSIAKGNLIKKAVGEATEEAIMPYVENGYKAIFLDEEMDWEETTEEALKSAGAGATLGLVMGSGGKGYSKVDTVINKINNGEKVSDSEMAEAIKELETNEPGAIQEAINKATAVIKEDIQVQKTTEEDIAPIQKEIEEVVEQPIQEKVDEETQAKRSHYQYTPIETDSEFTRELKESASRVMNNTKRSHEFVETVSKIAEKTGTKYKFTNNAELTENGYGVEGKTVNGLVTENGEVLINIDSNKALNSIVGHETLHLVENEAEFNELKEFAKQYATIKGEYESRLQSTQELYKGINANIENEVTADIVGDYLFTDQEFINSLSVEKPNFFKKIYNEIKHWYNMATAGSKEARQLEQLKHSFEKALNSKQQSGVTANGETKYMVTGKKGHKQLAKELNDPEFMNNYNEALEMDKNNAASGDIRKETGWYKDANNDWKFEISDKDSKIKENVNLKANSKYTVSEILDHKTLQEMYPHLDNTKVVFEDLGTARGRTNKLTGTIYINNNLINDKAQLKKTLLHEIQHNIQRKEGFQQGTTTAEQNDNYERYKNNFGETEARETADRIDLTFEERQNNPSYTSTYQEGQKGKKLYTKKDNKWYNLLGGNYEEVNTEDTKAHQTNTRDDVVGVNEELDDSSFFNEKNTKDNQGRKLSKEQQEYFKDSKVRDENGNLLRMYHGSAADFTVFDKNKIGSATGTPIFGKGFYFTNRQSDAKGYSDNSAMSKGKVYKAYLNITNPYIATDDDIGRLNTDELVKQGYDGVEIRTGTDKHYVAFESNQIKNVDNTKPTSDADIRYSLSEDNEGNEIKPAMQKWAENSKARDENGNLKVLYHGTATGEFTVFDKNKANPEGDWGAGFYLTDNEYDVERNYEDGGPDFDGKVSKLAEQIESEEDISYEEAEEKAREQLYKGSYKITSYANIEKPAIVGQTYLFNQDDYYDNYNMEDFDSEEEYYEAIDQLVADDIDSAIWAIEKEYDFYNGTDDIRNLLYEAYYDGGMEIQNLKDRLGELYLETDEGLVGHDVARIIIESLGYDGIIDPTVSGKWNGMDMDEGTTHYIVFKPNQIKNITNENPTDNPDINLSLSNQNEDIAPTGNYNVYGEDVKVQVEEAIAPLKEQIEELKEALQTPAATQPTKAELDNLMALQKTGGTEYANTFFGLRDKYGQAKLYKGLNEYKKSPNTYGIDLSNNFDEDIAPATQESADNQALENLNTLTSEDAPLDEGAFIMDEETTLEGKGKKNIINDIRSNFNIKTTEARELYNKIAAAEYPTVEDVFNELQDYKTIKYEQENDYYKDIKNHIKGTKLNISKIKGQITDYNNSYRMSLMGKGLILGNSGQDVDSFYQELNEMYPGVFPADITAEVDQLDRISEFMYEDTTQTFAETIPDEALYELAQGIHADIGNNERYRGSLAHRYFQNQAIKDGEIKAPVESQEEYLKTLPDVLNDDLAPYLDMAKEINAEKTSGYSDVRRELDRMSTNTQETNNQAEKGENDSNKPKAKATKKSSSTLNTLNYLFNNRNEAIDRFSRETGNKNIKFLADHVNNVFGEVSTNINNAQTDNHGRTIGKSITDIFNQARKEKLSEAFNDYLFHKSNVERHKQSKGSKIPVLESSLLVKEYNETYPQFKKWAAEVNQYNKNNLYKQVDAGLYTRELADKITKMYDFYVPFFEDIESVYLDGLSREIGVKGTIKRAKGGADRNLVDFEEAMIRQTQSTITAIRKNQLYREIIESSDEKTLLGNNNEPINSLYKDENGYYVSAYVDGQQQTAKISEDLFKGLENKLEQQVKDIEQKLSKITKPLQAIGNIRRNILTSWSPSFAITNPLKDLQDAPLNSKYAASWAKNYPKALKELTTGKGEHVQEFLNMYGQANLMGNYSTDSGLSDITKVAKVNKKLSKVFKVNEIMEMIPRYAEYLASLEHGTSQMEALYNAREVTTNFGRGGVITKALNRNGFTFLNASVQGFNKLYRNFSGENGAKGVVNATLKATILGVAPALFNELAFGGDDDKDEEYEALPDYIKDNYYLIKTDDGEFIRIPKGRMLSIFGSAARRTLEFMQGEKDAFDGYFKNAYSQVGIQNPMESNILAPLIQAYGSENGETWYGTDIVPSRLQKVPDKEQYDETIDAFSIWLGDKTGISPYKLNYVLDQYSGGIGDIVLPMITEEATSDAETIPEMMLAPIKDKFTANSTTDNKYVSDVYSLSDELYKKSNSKNATEEDLLRNQYIYSITSDMGELYAERRAVQNDDSLTKAEKYERSQAIKDEINRLAKEGLDNYQSMNRTENYAIIGGREFNKYTANDGTEKWGSVFEDELEEMNALGMELEEKSEYVTAKKTISATQSSYDGSSDYAAKKRDIISIIKDTNLSDEQKAYLYDRYYASTDTLNTVTTLGIDFDSYLDYESQEFEADKDSKGNSISGSKKKKVFDYINTMEIEFEQKLILAKLQYPSYDEYNYEIVEYLNNSDLSYEEEVALLKKMKFEVDDKGNIYW